MKQKLREKHLEKRKKIPAKVLGQKSKKIAELLFSTKEFQNAKTIMAFIPVLNEPETKGIIEEAWKQGKTVCVPATDFAEKKITPIQITCFSELEEKKFGLLEPKNLEKKVPESNIDLVIVPGVAFDASGNRLGYGGGFFDIFLKKNNCNSIGICLEQHIEEKLPAEAHDRKVKKIVTEKRIIDCQKRN